MSNLTELIQQRAALEQEIARLRKAERDNAIAKVKALMRDYDLSVADLGKVLRLQAGGGSQPRAKVAAKFRDPATGDSWSGRGLMPKWLKAHVAAGHSKETYAV